MCHQSVGLVARVLEASGIATVALSNLLAITRRVKPPRTLSVESPRGETAGPPDDGEIQRERLKQALRLLQRDDPPGLMVDETRK